MKVEFYDTKKRKKLLEKLNSQFGITSIPSILFETGREKIRGFSGDLTIDELYALAGISNIEFMGMYLFKQDMEFMRLGFDGALLLKKQIVKNIIDLTDEQVENWMNGYDLDVVLESGIYVIRHKEDVFGCGVSNGRHLINFVPKERRIRRG
ncbi:hypothetical protein J4416_02460 [Candidatus Pacearchaeota archaeon]|nr:hypothetical protein [Candidatus Pacearchaeota archaeon]